MCGCGEYGHRQELQAFQPKWCSSSPVFGMSARPTILPYAFDSGIDIDYAYRVRLLPGWGSTLPHMPASRPALPSPSWERDKMLDQVSISLLSVLLVPRREAVASGASRNSVRRLALEKRLAILDFFWSFSLTYAGPNGGCVRVRTIPARDR